MLNKEYNTHQKKESWLSCCLRSCVYFRDPL